MKLTKSHADVFVPDGSPVEAALARTTHLAIGAHQDDLEFMSLHGILECFDDEARCYTGVTVTDGSGSPRTGPYAEYSGKEMREVRVAEQRKAALLGRYGCQIQLMWSSAGLKDSANSGVFVLPTKTKPAALKRRASSVSLSATKPRSFRNRIPQWYGSPAV